VLLTTTSFLWSTNPNRRPPPTSLSLSPLIFRFRPPPSTSGTERHPLTTIGDVHPQKRLESSEIKTEYHVHNDGLHEKSSIFNIILLTQINYCMKGLQIEIYIEQFTC
jgi:hypothetical protein